METAQNQYYQGPYEHPRLSQGAPQESRFRRWLGFREIPTSPVKVAEGIPEVSLHRYEVILSPILIDRELAEAAQLTEDDVEFLSQYKTRLGVWTSERLETPEDFASMIAAGQDPRQPTYVTLIGSGLSSRGEQWSQVPQPSSQESQPEKVPEASEAHDNVQGAAGTVTGPQDPVMEKDKEDATSLIHMIARLYEDVSDEMAAKGFTGAPPRHLIITVDAPGFGGSSLTDPDSAQMENCGSKAYARYLDLMARLLQINPERALYIGHSLGAEAGLEWAYSSAAAGGKKPLNIPVVAFNPSGGMNRQPVFSLLNILSRMSKNFSPPETRDITEPARKFTEVVPTGPVRKGGKAVLSGLGTVANHLEEFVMEYFLSMRASQRRSAKEEAQFQMHLDEMRTNLPAFIITLKELARKGTIEKDIEPPLTPVYVGSEDDRLTRFKHAIGFVKTYVDSIRRLTTPETAKKVLSHEKLIRRLQNGHDAIFTSWEAQKIGAGAIISQMRQILAATGYEKAEGVT